MNVKLNPAAPKAATEENQIKVADEQATADVQANAQPEQQPEQQSEQLNITEQPKITETPVVETPKEPVSVDGIASFVGRERVPSDWTIREEDGELVFTNSVTARRLVGITVEQFNALLKG